MAEDAGSPSRTREVEPGLVKREMLARRTWELELLISGALVFSLLQVPGGLARVSERIGSQLDGGLRMMSLLGYVYLQLGIVCLIAALLIHLVARALWVGLIGLDAVFPRGIRWRRLTTSGPRMLALYRLRLPRVPALIRGIDAFCNSIFSIAFAFALVFFVSIFFIAPLAGLSALIDRLAFGQGPRLGTFYILLVILIGPIIVIPLIDRKVPLRPRRRWLDRMVAMLMRPYYVLSGGPVYAAISFTLLSNVKKRAYFLGLGAIMVALFAGFMIATLVSADVLQLHSRRYAPAVAGAREMVNEHYENLRSADLAFTGPSIDGDVIEGDYVRLFLPYLPRRHNAQVAERCPSLEPLQSEGLILARQRNRTPTEETEAKAREAIRCLGGLWQIDLDGTPVDAGRFDFFRHPSNGMVGLIGYLPVRALPPGRHVLRLRVRIDPGDDEDGLRIHHIPFWT